MAVSVARASVEQEEDLMKIEALNQIANILSMIETDLSDFQNMSDPDPEESEAVTKLMERLKQSANSR